MMRGQDNTGNTAAQIAYDPVTDVRDITSIIRDRRKVADIKKHGQVIDNNLVGWGWTHHVGVPYETDRVVGYAICGNYYVNLTPSEATA